MNKYYSNLQYFIRKIIILSPSVLAFLVIKQADQNQY
jgi:hypothetical protein